MPLDLLAITVCAVTAAFGLFGYVVFDLARALRPTRVETLDEAPLDSLWIDDPFFDDDGGMDELLDDVPYAARADSARHEGSRA